MLHNVAICQMGNLTMGYKDCDYMITYFIVPIYKFPSAFKYSEKSPSDIVAATRRFRQVGDGNRPRPGRKIRETGGKNQHETETKPGLVVVVTKDQNLKWIQLHIKHS